MKFQFGPFFLQSSVYRMNLENELHLNPITGANTNFDPTRRTGVETLASWNVTDWLRLKGNLTRQEAIYREGPFQGKFVPVVSKWTANAGLSMDLWQKYLTFDAVMVEYLHRKYYQPRKIQMRACHPRDLIDQVIDRCRYEGRTPAISRELLDLACGSYFLEEAESQGNEVKV